MKYFVFISIIFFLISCEVEESKNVYLEPEVPPFFDYELKNRQYPGFHIIDHVIYHTTFDIPELVPAEGMKRATKAFIGMIEDVNELSLEELR